MPRVKRTNRRPAKSAPKPDPILEIARDMHVPMNEAKDLIQALELVGLGMTELGSDHSCAVTTIARATLERLTLIDEAFLDLMQVARGGPRP
jgi:hypothetical protein